MQAGVCITSKDLHNMNLHNEQRSVVLSANIRKATVTNTCFVVSQSSSWSEVTYGDTGSLKTNWIGVRPFPTPKQIDV